MTSRYCLYTAVLPPYREACLQILARELGPEWTAYAGDQHLDATVRSAGNVGLYVPVRNSTLGGRRLLLQSGHWREVIRAETAILDLNPRSLTAWGLLLTRRLLHRRTVLWGHLHPRSGADSRTAKVRAQMRRSADGAVVYSYADADYVRARSATERVWVAPNALYRRAEMGEGTSQPRDSYLYVGRLEPAKKPELLVQAFALVAQQNAEVRLVFIGGGSAQPQLEAEVAALGLRDRVSFLGALHSVSALREAYSRAICSVSPGYAGLSLTQSLSFGVPMVIAESEPHAPEIELAAVGGVTFFRSDSAVDLAAALSGQAPLPDAERQRLIDVLRERYSAEAMAAGLIAALTKSPVSQRPSTPATVGSR